MLNGALPSAMLYDPEIIGYVLRRVEKIVPLDGSGTGDFQDIGVWRPLVVRTARILRSISRRTLVVPMTLANPAYLYEIREGLRRIDADLHHFCLTASVATIHKRLSERGDPPAAWSFKQTQRCVQAYGAPPFAEWIDSEQYAADAVVDLILRRVAH